MSPEVREWYTHSHVCPVTKWRLACMMQPIDLQPISLWQLLLNNPEWVAVLAAVVTVIVIIWQVCVMIWQGRTSARHERTQNKLIRLQHEHEWVRQRNQERAEIAALTRKLHRDIGPLLDHKTVGGLIWGETLDTADELRSRLSILDIAIFAGPYDHWFPKLEGYVDAVLKAITDDTSGYPSEEARKKLADAEKQGNPIGIGLEIEAAIRMDFFEFKQKWDALLQEPT